MPAFAQELRQPLGHAGAEAAGVVTRAVSNPAARASARTSSLRCCVLMFSKRGSSQWAIGSRAVADTLLPTAYSLLP